MNNKYTITGIILLVLAICLITTGLSFAFFEYTRTSKIINVIKMGNIEFSMLDGDSVLVEEQFPKGDMDGNLNTPYTFTVNNKSSEGLMLYYNLSFLDNNKDANNNYFTNNQIKYSLVKNGGYVVGTSAASGNKLSTIDGFSSTDTTGEGVVLKNQAIDAGSTDTYKLRIWISNDVNYSSSIDENGLMTGKYNDYKYSLKVKVNASDKNN